MTNSCEAIWKREFKLPWREAGPPDHHDDTVDSDQQVVNKELSLRTSEAIDDVGVGRDAEEEGGGQHSRLRRREMQRKPAQREFFSDNLLV